MYVHKRQREDIRINKTRILIMYAVKSLHSNENKLKFSG